MEFRQEMAGSIAMLSQANTLARATDTVLKTFILRLSALFAGQLGGVESQHDAGRNVIHIKYLHNIGCGRSREGGCFSVILRGRI